MASKMATSRCGCVAPANDELTMTQMEKPRVSILLTTYNHRETIAAAIAAALAQTYSPLEILISDDCSTDDSWQMIEAAVAGYQGPHTLRLNRNSRNMGIGAHLSYLAQQAQGELLFVAAGDDISLPERCEKVVAAWQAQGGKPDLIACDLYDMAYDGTVHGVLRMDDLAQCRSLQDWVERHPYLVGAGHTWHRRLFGHFGPMAAGVRMEDQVMTLRAVLQGGAMTLAEPLVQYRRGGVSGKRRVYSSRALLDRWQKSGVHAIAELEQSIADAACCGLEAEARARFAPTLSREHYVQQMCAAQGWLARLNLFLQAGKVPMRWRLRIFVHAALPWLTAGFFLLKRMAHAIRGK